MSDCPIQTVAPAVRPDGVAPWTSGPPSSAALASSGLSPGTLASGALDVAGPPSRRFAIPPSFFAPADDNGAVVRPPQPTTTSRAARRATGVTVPPVGR